MTSVEFIVQTPVATRILSQLHPQEWREVIRNTSYVHMIMEALLTRRLVAQRTIVPPIGGGQVYSLHRLTAEGWLTLRRAEEVIGP